MGHSSWCKVGVFSPSAAGVILIYPSPLAAAKQMEQQKPQGGSIVAVSSISALVGGALQTHYTPTKAGVLSLMQSCAVALGKYNIRCNAVLPGMRLLHGRGHTLTTRIVGTIATDINKEDLSDVKKREYMESRTCLGRLGGKTHINHISHTSMISYGPSQCSSGGSCRPRCLPCLRYGSLCHGCIAARRWRVVCQFAVNCMKCKTFNFNYW